MRWLRGCAHALFFISTVASANPATAGRDVMESFAMLAKGDLIWEAPQRMLIGGQPAYWRAFQSPKKLMVVAAGLSEFSGVFQRALMLHGKVLLSGVEGDRHWVAELTSAHDGVTGILSMLPLSPVRAMSQTASDLNWLDTIARQHAEYETNERSVVQRVYSSTMNVNDVRATLNRQLSSGGWSSAPVSERNGFQYWHRGSHSLMVLVMPTASGSTLFVFWSGADVVSRGPQ